MYLWKNNVSSEVRTKNDLKSIYHLAIFFLRLNPIITSVNKNSFLKQTLKIQIQQFWKSKNCHWWIYFLPWTENILWLFRRSV